MMITAGLGPAAENAGRCRKNRSRLAEPEMLAAGSALSTSSRSCRSSCSKDWRRSRPTKWLERNPLPVVRARQIPGGSFYPNEGLLLSRIQAATAQIALLAGLEPRNEALAGTLFSSRIINNWETLDIQHYPALFDTGGQRKQRSGRSSVTTRPATFRPGVSGHRCPGSGGQPTLSAVSSSTNEVWYS